MSGKSRKPTGGINFDKLTTFHLSNDTVDGLGRWNRGLKKPIGTTRLPFDEGVIALSIKESGVGEVCHIYFNDLDKEQRVKCEIYIDKRFHTQWYINYQRTYFNTDGMTLESIPDDPNEFNLIYEMGAILSHALIYYAMYNENPNLVLQHGNSIRLQIPENAPETPSNIKKVKPKLDYDQPIALDPLKSLAPQISAHLNEYYRSWIHQPIPALNGKTPVEAAKTPEGRKELFDLFEYMRNAQSSVPFPFDDVKRTLGM